MNAARLADAARRFVTAFISAFLWTVRFMLGLTCVGWAFIALITLTLPDAELLRTLSGFSHAHAQPLRVMLLIAIWLLWGLATWLDPTEKSSKAEKAFRAKAAQELQAKDVELTRKDAALAEIVERNEALNKVTEDFALILSSAAVRRAVLHCWHPDKARSEKERLAYTEIFKLADGIFKDLA